MNDAKTLLDTLMKSGGEAAAKAREAWDTQSVGTKGALAGGLLGVLFGGGRGGLGSVARVGGLAAIGSLAAKAFADWQAAQGAQTAAADAPQPDQKFLPSDGAAADDLSARLLKAMVAVAKADGRVTDEERTRITGQFGTLGLGPEAAAMLEAELATPLDVDAIAALAHSPQEATAIYAASLLVAKEGGPAETDYLAALATGLNLDPALVAQLQARVAQLT